MTTLPSLDRFAKRVAAIATADRVPLDSVLRDHALSYVLLGIAGVPELRANLVFKGGTALRKCYFPTYRYSQDLDFSTRQVNRWSDDEFGVLLRHACRLAEEATAGFGVYEFVAEPQRHAASHSFGQLDFNIRIEYPTGANNLPIKVEVTQDEPILLDIDDRAIHHRFDGEGFQASIPTYSLEEVVLEKLRAFLQARDALNIRGWTNRGRDLYDLYVLHHDHRDEIRWGELLDPLHKKATARGVTFIGSADFQAPELLAAYRDAWERVLGNLVPGELPDFDDAVAEQSAILEKVFAG